MRERCAYILGIDWRRFKMVGIRGARNYNSDHFALRDRLLICRTEAGHHCSVGGIGTQIGAVRGGREEAGI